MPAKDLGVLCFVRGGRNNAGPVPCFQFRLAGHWLLAGALLEVCCKVSKVRSHVGKEAKEGRANNSEHVGGGNCQCRDDEERCDQKECEGYDVQCLSGGVLQCLAFRLGGGFLSLSMLQFYSRPGRQASPEAGFYKKLLDDLPDKKTRLPFNSWGRES